MISFFIHKACHLYYSVIPQLSSPSALYGQWQPASLRNRPNSNMMAVFIKRINKVSSLFNNEVE